MKTVFSIVGFGWSFFGICIGVWFCKSFVFISFCRIKCGGVLALRL